MSQPVFYEYNIVMSRLCSLSLAVLQPREFYEVPHKSPIQKFEFGRCWSESFGDV